MCKTLERFALRKGRLLGYENTLYSLYTYQVNVARHIPHTKRNMFVFCFKQGKPIFPTEPATTQRLPWSWTTSSELKQWLFLDDEM